MRKLIKSAFHSVGLDVTKYRPNQTSTALFVKMLATNNINLVFDIGANTGQFGYHMRESGYSGRIVSFEPLSAAYHKLAATSRRDKNWQVAPQMAIGDTDGTIEINIANNSESSSLLNMLDSHKQAAADSFFIGTESVAIRQLDSVATAYMSESDHLLVKIDTQGYEDKVLKGASATLEKAVGVQLELSLTPLYEGQMLYTELVGLLGELGFELWAINPIFSNNNNGRMMQVDGTFFRKN